MDISRPTPEGTHQQPDLAHRIRRFDDRLLRAVAWSVTALFVAFLMIAIAVG
jgi:hypothetical protein